VGRKASHVLCVGNCRIANDVWQHSVSGMFVICHSLAYLASVIHWLSHSDRTLQEFSHVWHISTAHSTERNLSKSGIIFR